jgi:regulatory protein
VPDDDLERCHISALRILGYRWNSEAELRRKLASKRFDKEVIETTIARLRDEKWLDDDRFAEAFVRTKASKRMGRGRIKGALRAAGVDSESAERAIRANLDPEKEMEGLKVLCAKRMRMLVRRHGEEFLGTNEGRNKLTAWLLNQGYDAALVHSAIKELKVVDHH